MDSIVVEFMERTVVPGVAMGVGARNVFFCQPVVEHSWGERAVLFTIDSSGLAVSLLFASLESNLDGTFAPSGKSKSYALAIDEQAARRITGNDVLGHLDRVLLRIDLGFAPS